MIERPQSVSEQRQGVRLSRPGMLRGGQLYKLMVARFGVMGGLLLLVIVFASLSPTFLSVGNLTNILVQAGTNGILAAGMTFVILTGNIDLSVGPTLALSSVVAARYMANGGSIVVGVGLALVIGILCGLVNGLCVARFRLPAFIVTLATMWLYRGLAYVYTGAQAVLGLPRSFRFLATGTIVGIPNVVIVLGVVYGLSHFVLARTRFGRYVYAIGDNEEAARLSGINIVFTKTLVFVISGFLAALGGVVYTSRLFSGQPVAGMGYELSAIAAAVIGGTSLSGGVGQVSSTLVGAIFISTLMNGLIILNVSAFWQQVFMGLVILGAVFVDHYRKSLTTSTGRARSY